MTKGHEGEEFEVYQPELEDWQAKRPEHTTRRLDTLRRLLKENEKDAKRGITGQEFVGGILFRKIVEDYYAVASGMGHLSEEQPPVGGDGDPIRLYAKGRRVYRPTQRPRNVARPRTSFDGWTSARSKALKTMHRLRVVLTQVDDEARRALFAIVIDPDNPHARPLSVTAYCLKRHGYRDPVVSADVVSDLKRALIALHAECPALVDTVAAFSEAA